MFEKKEEFSRDDPESYKKYYWLRALNYVVPLLIVTIGIFVTTQKFAPMMNYDPSVIGRPLLVFKSGYRLYNPMIFILGMFKFALSEAYSYYFFQAAPPAILSLILAMLIFLIASVILNSHQKNQHIHGTARCATWGICSGTALSAESLRRRTCTQKSIRKRETSSFTYGRIF